MAQTPGSDVAVQVQSKDGKYKKALRTIGAASVSLGLVGTFALPAYASITSDQREVEFSVTSHTPQALTAAPATTEGLEVSAPTVVEDATVLERERLVAQAQAVQEQQAQIQAQQQAQAAQQAQGNGAAAVTTTTVDLPAGAGATGLLDAALAQLGQIQDCTALVERALRAIGLPAGDLGTGIWQYDGYGTRVSLDALAPGDILIYGNAASGAHVAIYAGNGMAVHAGMPGTIIAPTGHAWEKLSGAIRLS